MKLEQFIDKMIPVSLEKQMPCFSEILTLDNLKLSNTSITELQLLITEMDPKLYELDIAVQLKWLRKINKNSIKDLEIKVIEAYFSHPYVVSRITRRETTLFPHKRVLPDINFELLEAVMCLDERIFNDGQ